MENIFSRIKQMISYYGDSNNEFGRKIGCSSAQVTQMLTHNRNFSIDKLLNILSSYEDISAEWLTRGTNSMLRKQIVQKNDKNTSTQPVQWADNENEYTNNNVFTQENSFLIEKLLERLERQSEKIGRLENENTNLREQLNEKSIYTGAMERAGSKLAHTE